MRGPITYEYSARASAAAPTPLHFASGVLASGAIVSLIDTASGTSVWVTLDTFTPIVTVDLRLDYLRPALKGETIVARCECVKVTRRIAFVRGAAHGGDESRPIALSAATFMLGR